MRQEYLAEKVGIKPATLSGILNGKKKRLDLLEERRSRQCDPGLQSPRVVEHFRVVGLVIGPMLTAVKRPLPLIRQN